MAEACILVNNLVNEIFKPLSASDRNDGFGGEIAFDIIKPDGTMRKLMNSSRLNQLGWNVSALLKAGLQQSYQDFLKNTD